MHATNFSAKGNETFELLIPLHPVVVELDISGYLVSHEAFAGELVKLGLFLGKG